LAAQTNEVVLTFLSLSHPDLSAPLYVVNNNVAIVKDGVTFAPFPFAISLPADTDGNIGNASLTIDAVDLSIITALKSIDTAPTVSLVVALASDPQVTELDLGEFTWKEISYNEQTVSGELTYSDTLDLLVPSIVIDPVDLPGSF
jgi:hypothetical protein